MPGDQVTYATADQLIDVHGAKALSVARNAARRFERRGDAAGERIWRDILAAVESLLDEETARRPPDGIA